MEYIEHAHYEEVDLILWEERWPNFTPKEMACRCGCGKLKISTHLMDLLEYLRIEVNKALPVTSGYRCSQYNDRISGSGLDGPHTTGKAVDIGCFGELAVKVVWKGVTSFTRIGINQKGEMNSRFIHLDLLKTPWIWSY